MILKKNGQATVRVSELAWDSEIFGIKCGSLYIISDSNNDSIGVLIKEAIEEARRQKFRFVTTKIDAQELSTVNACFNNRGLLVDTELSYRKPRRAIDPTLCPIPENIRIEKHFNYWDERLFELADTLVCSRFLRDENIAQEMALKVWKTSIHNNCTGRANYSIMCFDEDRPVGLMNIFEKESVSEIFLIALLPGYQNRGLGRRMMDFYESNLDIGITEMVVETQLVNYRANVFYSKRGYNLYHSKHIIHFWL